MENFNANQTANNQTIALHTSIDSAALLTQNNERLIVCRFKNPARAIAANIPNDAWQQMESAVDNLQYRSLLDAVLIEAAKSILSNYYLNIWETNKVTVSSIPLGLINADAILEEASGNNSEWMTKEELTNAWKESATRNAVYNQQRYATDKAYQRAYTRFEEMILKLAGKTSTYQMDELDVILAKLNDADLNTQFGQFIVRRIEALRNKPIKADVDLSVL